ncbi:hypothetical protein C4M96_00500 [Mycoplasmopsis pullorum]|nr:hypothetical protein [Mycoplasmopsis pullorum]TNK82295.1 hypothetical protein C4M93_03890 [Mycoplasmopsis pullorum]TNK92516.1 hypothetical protein C4M96_00500 [Mycoplasmopsis pullorum]
MSINHKFLNYNLNQNIDLVTSEYFDDFVSKKIINPQFLEFIELANSYTNKKLLNKILEIANVIKTNKSSKVVVFGNYWILRAIKACISFIDVNPYMKNKKDLEIILIDETMKIQNIKDQLKNLFYSNEDVTYVVCNFNLHNSNFIRGINSFISSLKNKKGYFYLSKRIILIKELFSKESQFNFRFESNLVLTISNTVASNFAFFSEISLLILSLLGINIIKFLNGFKSAQNAAFNNEINENIPLQLAWFMSNESKICYFNLNNPSLESIFHYFVSVLNSLSKNVFFDFGVFPNNFYSTSQMLFQGKNNKSIIFVKLEKEYFDYQISSDVSIKDLLSDLRIKKISNYSNESFDVLTEYTSSFSHNLISVLSINKKDETHLGNLIGQVMFCLIYWSIINQTNVFLK